MRARMVRTPMPSYLRPLLLSWIVAFCATTLTGYQTVLSTEGVVNGASFARGPVARGEIVTIFASGIGAAQATIASYDATGKLPTALAETRVLFDGVAAPMVYSAPGQISAIVPYLVRNSTTQLQVETRGTLTGSITLPIAAAVPAVFTANSSGSGQARAVNVGDSGDLTFNTADTPANPGQFLTLYITGEGDLTPPIAAGVLPTAGAYPAPVMPVMVSFGGVPSLAADNWAGLVYAGVTQLNVRVPPAAPAGASVPVAVTIAGMTSQAGATVAIRSSSTTAQPDCERETIHCAGPGQEFQNIQAAANRAAAGHIVYVFPGSYSGFQVTRSGTANAPITFKAFGDGVIINRDGPTGDGVRLQDVSYIVIDGFDIRDVSQRCIAARGARAAAPMYGDILRNNRCTNAGYEGFYLSQFHSAVIENNFITGAGRGFDLPHAIYLANSGSKNTIIRGNRIVDSNDIHFNGDASVEGADGLITGLLIENNQIWNAPQNGLNMDGVQDSTIRNNLVINAGNSGLRVYQIDGAAGPKNLKIYNNTFLSTRGRWPIKLTADLGGHVIFNNILLTTATDAGSLCTGNTAFQSGFNITTGRFSSDEEKTIVDLTRWRTAGFDTNSLVAVPAELFADMAALKFQLKAGSAGVDAGAMTFAGVTAPTADVIGTTRPQRRGIDIGAYELP